VPLVCGNKSEKFTSAAAACNLERPLIFHLDEWFSDFPRSFPLYWAPLIIAAVFPSLARSLTFCHRVFAVALRQKFIPHSAGTMLVLLLRKRERMLIGSFINCRSLPLTN
jgi:hypothetical protein